VSGAERDLAGCDGFWQSKETVVWDVVMVLGRQK